MSSVYIRVIHGFSGSFRDLSALSVVKMRLDNLLTSPSPPTAKSPAPSEIFHAFLPKHGCQIRVSTTYRYGALDSLCP
jgi:hypothetical protein